jgi:hypothetical protein
MPLIFDNIQLTLFDGLRAILPEAEGCSFCVGYLNLRGWGQLADFVRRLPGGDESRACRLLVGMHRAPEEEMKALSGVRRGDLPALPAALARPVRLAAGQALSP